MWGHRGFLGSRFLLVLILGIGPDTFRHTNASDDADATPSFQVKYKETEKRSMRSFWKINHPQSYQVLDMRLKLPKDGSSRFEVISIGDVMQNPGYNSSILPVPGDALVSVDDIPVATGSLQDMIQDFMTAGGDDRTKIMDKQFVFPLVHATSELQEENNWYCYQDRYPDVKQKTRKYDAQAIRNHYVLTGRAEGRNPKCDPNTPADAHGFRLRGFMYVNLVGLYQPDSFDFVPTDPDRQRMLGGAGGSSLKGGAAKAGGAKQTAAGRSGSGRSSDGRSRNRRERPKPEEGEEESGNDRRRRAAEKKEQGSGERSKTRMLSKEEEAQEKKREEMMRAETERVKELEKLRNAADMKRERLLEEQRVRESWTAKRQSGEAFDYWMRIENEGPMGLTFNVGQPITEVQEVRPGSVANNNNVHAGDQLIAVNGRDVSKMSPAASVRVIGASEWPRVLEFRVFEKKKSTLPDENSGERQVLRITTPRVLQGDTTVSIADWGGELEEDYCRAFLIVEASPANGCSSHSDTVTWAADEAEPIVLMRRGQCAYTDKARAIQKGGGATAGLVVNSENKLIEMPAGKTNVDDIELPMVMMASVPGSKLFDVLSWKLPVRGWIGSNDTCTSLIPPDELTDGALFKNGESGGRFDIQTATQTATFDWKLSSFGPQIFDYSNMVILADPPQGCTPNGHKVRIKGAIAVLERGGCGFADKVLSAQEAGAAAVIVVNNDVSIVAMMADDRVTNKITIPSIMVSSRFMEFKVLMRRRRESALGRIVREKFIGHYDDREAEDD